MKKRWKNLLVVIGLAAAGFVAYTLRDDHTRK